MKIMIYDITVTRVVDGDTVICDIDLGFSIVLLKQRVRFLGVNTPELRGGDQKSKALAMEAKIYVEDLLVGKNCRLETQKAKEYDNFGRILGVVHAGGINVSEALLKTNHAVPM